MRLLNVLSVLLLAGCGQAPAPCDAGRPDAGPPKFKAGDGCQCVGGAPPCGVCDDGDTALFCEGPTGAAKFVAFQCPGKFGCVDFANGGMACDFQRTTDGTACPSSMTGQALCDVPGGVLGCRLRAGTSEAFWARGTCSSCSVSSSGTVSCAP